MFKFWPIFKRELFVYFRSPIAYAVIVMFLLICGYLFASSVLTYSLMSMQAAQSPFAQLNVIDMVVMPLTGGIGFVMLFMIPILTMRLFAEEKKSGTFELLTSYPLRDVDIVLGKYLACLFVLCVMIAATGVYHLILWALGAGDPGVVFTSYLGLFLVGAAFISAGLFISSLTENQIVAAVMSFGMLLIFWLIGLSASRAGESLKPVLEYLALVGHLVSFSRGVLDTADAAYYLLFTAFFLFMTLRSLESKRWRG